MRVFVSHGSHDTWIARQMARNIGECGAEVLIDVYDLASGDDVAIRLSALLAQADELVVLFTPFFQIARLGLDGGWRDAVEWQARRSDLSWYVET